MVNVKHRQCAEPGCSTRPAFNWKGEEKGQFCNKHKEKGMVNVDRKEPRPGLCSFCTMQIRTCCLISRARGQTAFCTCTGTHTATDAWPHRDVQ